MFSEELLNYLPSREVFEMAGIFVGLFACLMIFIQIVREIKLKARSSISVISALGWAMIFGFWVFYGAKLGAQAIFYANIVSTTLQIILLGIVIGKNRQYPRE